MTWRPVAGEPLVARVAVVWPAARGGGDAVEAVASATGRRPVPHRRRHDARRRRTPPVVHVRPASGVLA